MTQTASSTPAARDAARETAGAPVSRRQAIMAVLVCWLLVVFDGYDLIVYGTVQSSLLAEPGWGLNPASLGTVGSMAFIGMMIGALLAGRISDALGRRRTILACAIGFSVLTIACAFAPNAWVFGALRLLAGIGLGGLVPSANAMVAELVPRKWRSSIATLMMSGVPIGGSLAALLGIPIIPAFGWPAMFLVAAVALFIVVPLGFKYLPETLPSQDQTSQQTAPDTDDTSKTNSNSAGFGSLLRAPYVGMSLLFALITLCTLFAWYGLGTWLPNLMERAGYDLGSALTFALSLNLGAVLGSVATAWAGDRFGPVRAGAVAASLAGVALLALVLSPPVWVVYVVLVLAGVGTHGTQCLIIAAVANHYPDHLRGTALGWALGIGRIGAVAAPQLGGLLLAMGLGTNSNFIAFAIGSLLAGGLMIVVAMRASQNAKLQKTAA